MEDFPRSIERDIFARNAVHLRPRLLSAGLYDRRNFHEWEVIHVAHDNRGDEFVARGRERFLAGEPVVARVRSAILSSWRRCQSLGLTPAGVESTYQGEPDLDTDFVRAAQPVLDTLATAIAGAWVTVTLTDGDGVVLGCLAGEPRVTKYLEEVGGSAPGFSFHESLAGTNSIGLALVERSISRVHGHEHFADAWTVESCVAVPVHDPLSGRIVGVLDFASRRTEFAPTLEAMARKAGLAIERRLLSQTTDRERALLQAYLEAERRARLSAFEGRRRIDLGAPTDGIPNGSDRLIVEEKAAELIASGRRAAIEVPLSGGRAATLLARPVADASEGVSVEVVIPACATVFTTGDLPDSISTPLSRIDGHETARAPGSASSAPTVASVADGVVGRHSRSLLAVGEPGVGRLVLAARSRLELLRESVRHIGTTLDVARTSEELTEVVIENFADVVTVDLYPSVLCGDEPSATIAMLHRAAVGGRDSSLFYAAGEQVSFAPSTPQARCLACGSPAIEPDLKAAGGWAAQDLIRAGAILDQGFHSLIAVPLSARGVALGVASFYRSQSSVPFEDDDLCVASELVAFAAVCIDNARRYTREHTLALTLQRSLLPRGLPEQNALEVAHRYLPAHAGVGGDWFDVIPLSGTRVAMVVGDVVGHGVHAAAAMGRLRTAVRNFSTFELSPDELLAHLDDLVDQMAREESEADVFVGATCLYAIYDPTSRRCRLARAGHLPPALVEPDGTVTFPELPAGPPLGLGGFPFESAEIELPDASQLVLYTDGLVEDRERSIEIALEDLRRTLGRPHRSPEETCLAVIEGLPSSQPSDDDVTLLVVRPHGLDPFDIACWDDLPADPAIVPDIRAAVTQQLAIWELQEICFTTELILSELLTNAIRHATGPIQVRLLRDRTLVCEVSDTSCTSPHLRQAAATDEGGRGLFLVAQLAQRWGARYTAQGKVIWAEQPLPPA
ncbi:SpoIIE family protein phosphatase [Streptomyces sp. RB6PN25]|uniref:SpoIIE family protein phosphatase n=1 Tax=Streptomyces humicola TaxID=2953240 RepID=A0ABT1PN19_9ACTN|nr:SpoIIE family protein phosphatase [Streptomyces humicola]MCQ4079069.1 SpoIIE family protein phosphatase [Streptomyces humicola]